MILCRAANSGADDARFRTEAEAAASLHHPHIAQVFEAGEEHRQPFLVMEYVPGASLETVLAKAPLTAQSAAEIMLRLAEAMHYAHQHGVIHRDLKPSNVMLTPEGQPKITDFGLAKRLDDALSARVTQSGVVLGTPSYMPPEQAAGDHAAVGPRSDVYSMGAILYESVTGRPPYVADSLPEILQQIRAVDPVRPRRLNPQFPKDLETICLKCLEKQPAARYASAADVADDLRRFLHGEAIRARPARWWERCHKWSRRRPAIAALLGVTVVVTLLGITGVVWQTRRALLETRLSQATREFLDTILASINPDLARGRSITVREMLDEASAQLAAATDIHPRIQAGLHDTLGVTYFRIDEPEAAEKHLRSAWHLYQAQLGPRDPNTLQMMSNLALTLQNLDRLVEAEVLARQGLDVAQRSLGNRHRVTHLLLTNLAVIVDAQGRKKEAEQIYRNELTFSTTAHGPRHRGTLLSMSNLGAWLLNNGQSHEAEQLIEQCWKLQCEVLGSDHPETLVTMENLAAVVANSGRGAEAAAMGQSLLESSRRVHGPTAVVTLRRELELAKIQFSQGQRDEAITLGQHAFKCLRDRLGATHSQVLAATETLVTLLGLGGRLEEAESIALQSHSEVISQLGTWHSSVARMARLLANLYESWNRPEDQERWEEVARQCVARDDTD